MRLSFLALLGCSTVPTPVGQSPVEVELAQLRDEVVALQRAVTLLQRHDGRAVDKEVRCVKPEVFAVLFNTTEVASLGRALLHKGADGPFDGYRVTAIRGGSVLDQLGVKNGDILHEVDKLPVDSMEAVLDTRNRMVDKPPTRVTLGMTRRGLPYQMVWLLDCTT